MTKTRVIRVFSFILALTLVFAMMANPAYADYRQFGSWVLAALTAINITVESTLAPALQAANDLNQYLSYPFKIEGTQMIDIPYTFQDSDIADIMSRSTLSISGDTVTIDGVDYTDIWLSHDAANKFRVNAFDLEDAFDIASESEGTFVSGTGTYDGVPIFEIDNIKRSQNFGVPNSIGNMNFTLQRYMENYYWWNLNYTGGSQRSYSSQKIPLNCYLFKNNSGWYVKTIATSGSPLTSNTAISNSLFDDTDFDFDWVSGTIPAEELPEDHGLHYLVPNNPQQFTDDPQAQQVINNINNFYELNPELRPGVDVDLNDPGILDKLSDLMDLINGIVKLTKPLFGPKGVTPEDPIEPEPQPEPYPDPEPEPYPDPDPDPTTPLTDINWKSLFDVLKNIFQKLSNIDVTSQTIANTLTEFRNRFEDWMKNIRDNIVNKFDELSNILQNILDAVHDIADSIVHGNANWFRDIVDSIWNPFLRIFGIFKTHIGIWHYVVEWIQNITTPFRFFFNILTQLGTLYTSPIYAMFAGVLVIAIYRRFGR